MRATVKSLFILAILLSGCSDSIEATLEDTSDASIADGHGDVMYQRLARLGVFPAQQKRPITNVRILCDGDSITRGVESQNAWRGQLRDNLIAAIGTVDLPVTIRSFEFRGPITTGGGAYPATSHNGVDGSTCADHIGPDPAIFTTYQPDVATLITGSGEVNGGIEATFPASYMTLVPELFTAIPLLQLVVAHIPQHPGFETGVAYVNSQLSDPGGLWDQLDVLYPGRIHRAASYTLTDPPDFNGDHLHPNDAFGNPIIEGVMYPAMLAAIVALTS